jgi:hypothetical protein
VIFPVLAQSSATISLKLTKPFPSKHTLCSLVILRIDPILYVRSFKAFLLIGALFLVVLVALYACAR